MAHHSLIFYYKDKNKEIPENLGKALLGLNDEKYGLCLNIHIGIDHITMCYRYEHWEYYSDFVYGVKNKEFNQEIIDAFMWLYKNTTVEFDCWNASDSEFGPNSWNELIEDIGNEIEFKSNDNKIIRKFLKLYGYKISEV